MADKEEVNRVASKFEEVYGTDALLKVSFSSMARLLVAKGILTEDEILDQFIDEVGPAIDKLKEKGDIL